VRIREHLRRRQEEWARTPGDSAWVIYHDQYCHY
jgi:hypothetical protein